MCFQTELRNSKRIVREWIQTRFDDQKLMSVTAFNEDGKMTFRNPCGCLMGVTLADRLHQGQGCNRAHYWRARRIDLAATRPLAAWFAQMHIGRAEKAYLFLGFTPDLEHAFGDDQLRQRRFGAILRAEIRRRERNTRVPGIATAELTTIGVS